MTARSLKMRVLRGSPLLLSALVCALALLCLSAPAYAYPHFARQVGRDCGYCHSAFPKLNDTGRTFLYNGYRFEAEGEWRTVKDISSPPVSFEVEVEGIYDNVEKNGARSEASDLKVEEAEVIAGGAFGKDGRLSALFSVAAQQLADGTFETAVPKAFIQINDLIGQQATGMLNLKAGIGEIGLPFLRPTSTPITNAMFADSLIGAITSDERFLELNGSVVSDGEMTIAHRYRAGLSRERVQGENKLKGFYASWAATLDEAYSLGAILRTGEETVGAADLSYWRYGVAAEAETGPFILTAGYFKTGGDGASGDGWLGEALYFIEKFTFGGRYEAASVNGLRRATSQTLMARYDILSSAFVQFEYRHRRDPDMAAGGGETEDKARLILTALF